MNRTAKRIGALGTATVTVMGVGVAYAAWTANGSGNAYGNAKSITVTVNTAATDAAAADLEPGGSAGALVFKLGSTGLTGNVHVTDVTSSIAPGNTCDLSLNSAAVTSWLTTTRTVGSSGGTFTVPGALSMGTGAANSCQGQALVVPVTVSVST